MKGSVKYGGPARGVRPRLQVNFGKTGGPGRNGVLLWRLAGRQAHGRTDSDGHRYTLAACGRPSIT
jgi:hypothetical protein